MRYSHKEAKRDIRFIFSEEGLRSSEKSGELFIKVYNYHLLDKRRNKNRGKSRPCERCFKYYFKISAKFSKRRKE